MKKHYVTFYSPGTFMAEDTTKEIESWDTERACEMARTITERYNANPYGFRFFTRERADSDFEPKETERSAMFYINCEVLTLAQLKERDDPNERILRRNMESNGWDRVVQTTKGWKWTQPLLEGDRVLS